MNLKEVRDGGCMAIPVATHMSIVENKEEMLMTLFGSDKNMQDVMKRMSLNVLSAFLIIGPMVVMMPTLPSVYAAVLPGQNHEQLLPGNRILLGTVADVRGGQARIDTGKLQSRFLPMKVRTDKGLPELRKADRVEITVNDQNLLVDVHLSGESSHHRVVEGQLAQVLVTGHGSGVIRSGDGKEESHFIRSLARSKVASIAVGSEAVFLIDELNKIVDVTFLTKEAAARAGTLAERKSPLKGNFDRTAGVILIPLDNSRISIRTDEGTVHMYEVRSIVHNRLENLLKDDAVVLFVDGDNKVTDVAIPPRAIPMF